MDHVFTRLLNIFWGLSQLLILLAVCFVVGVLLGKTVATLFNTLRYFL